MAATAQPTKPKVLTVRERKSLLTKHIEGLESRSGPLHSAAQDLKVELSDLKKDRDQTAQTLRDLDAMIKSKLAQYEDTLDQHNKVQGQIANHKAQLMGLPD